MTASTQMNINVTIFTANSLQLKTSTLPVPLFSLLQSKPPQSLLSQPPSKSKQSSPPLSLPESTITKSPLLLSYPPSKSPQSSPLLSQALSKSPQSSPLLSRPQSRSASHHYCFHILRRNHHALITTVFTASVEITTIVTTAFTASVEINVKSTIRIARDSLTHSKQT